MSTASFHRIQTRTLCTQHKFYLTWWQQGTVVEWVWVSFTSIPHEEIKRRTDDNAVGSTGLRRRPASFKPGHAGPNLQEFWQVAAPPDFVWNCRCSLLWGEKSINLTLFLYKTFFFPPCVRKERSLYSISEGKLSVRPKTSVKHPSTVFRSHILIYWSMPEQRIFKRKQTLLP